MDWTDIAIKVLLFFYVIVCVFMCLVVLMQRSKQEGLGAAFGGSMMSDTFGAQTSQVLVKATVWLAALFFIFSISLARLYSHKEAVAGRVSSVQQELMKPVAPVTAPVTPAPAPVTPAPAAPVNNLPPAAPTQPATK